MHLIRNGPHVICTSKVEGFWIPNGSHAQRYHNMDSPREPSGESLLRQLDAPLNLFVDETLRPRRPWWNTNILPLATLILLFYIASLESIGLLSSSFGCECANILLNDKQPRTSATASFRVLHLLKSQNIYLLTVFAGIIPKDALKYEQRKEWLPLQHPWDSPPSPQLDNVWAELLYSEWMIFFGYLDLDPLRSEDLTLLIMFSMPKVLMFGSPVTSFPTYTRT